MRAKFTTALTVIGAVAVLTFAGNGIALAATGHGFILGKSNSANKVTTLSRTTGGSVLSLHSKSSSSAPLTVNGTGKVANLNVDKLDGLDSSALKTRSYIFTHVVGAPTTFVTVSVPVPVGTYLFNYSAYLSGATGETYCQIYRTTPTSSTYVGISDPSFATDPGITGSGAVTKAAGDTITFDCETFGHSFTTLGTTPIQLVMTPTAVIGNDSFRKAPRAATRVAGSRN